MILLTHARPGLLLWLTSPYFSDAYGHRGDSANDVRFGWESKISDLSPRLWTRNKDKLVPVEFTPTAGVTTAEFDEIDGAVELVLPIAWFYLILVLVNLDERARANQGKERVILKSDVPAETVPQVQLLQKTDGNLPPGFKHARD
jgi:hypothetical protein